MRVHIAILLLLASTTLLAERYEVAKSTAKPLVGVVGVGRSKGALCSLKIKSIMHTSFDVAHMTRYQEQVYRDGAWRVIRTLDFPMRIYGDTYEGSINSSNRKVVIHSFLDQGTNKYKAVIQENGLGELAREIPIFTVCEKMVYR